MRRTLLVVAFLSSLFTSSFTQTKKTAPTTSQTAASAAIAQAEYARANKLDNNKQYAAAFREYLLAANHGNAAAQFRLGEIYAHEPSYTPTKAIDLHKADFWYRKAAAQGYSFAATELGKIYAYQGVDGTGPDYAQSLSWYRQAADANIPFAQTELGNQYYDGRGTPKDFASAFVWYQKAAALGNPLGEFDLGLMFFWGRGTAQNYTSAANWFYRAALRGQPDAEYYLGYLYQNGLGVGVNQTLAREWLQKAANQGNANAKNSLAQLDAQSSPTAAQQAPSTPQGTCTAIHSALHSDNFGHWYSFGAAWGRSSLAEAESAARSELIKTSNGMSINFNSDEVLTPFSGCTYGHGAVVAKLKGINGSLLGNGIYDLVSGVVDATTQGAIASAMEDCNRVAGTGDSDGPCTVMLQW